MGDRCRVKIILFGIKSLTWDGHFGKEMLTRVHWEFHPIETVIFGRKGMDEGHVLAIVQRALDNKGQDLNKCLKTPFLAWILYFFYLFVRSKLKTSSTFGP